MPIISSNVSNPVEVSHEGTTVRTTIFKVPMTGPVRVGVTNLAGDAPDVTVSPGSSERMSLESVSAQTRHGPKLQVCWLARCRMRKVEEIEKQIQELSREEFAELRDWFLEHDRQIRDQQLEADSVPGELEEFVAAALAEHDSRQTRKP